MENKFTLPYTLNWGKDISRKEDGKDDKLAKIFSLILLFLFFSVVFYVVAYFILAIIGLREYSFPGILLGCTCAPNFFLILLASFFGFLVYLKFINKISFGKYLFYLCIVLTLLFLGLALCFRFCICY